MPLPAESPLVAQSSWAGWSPGRMDLEMQARAQKAMARHWKAVVELMMMMNRRVMMKTMTHRMKQVMVTWKVLVTGRMVE